MKALLTKEEDALWVQSFADSMNDGQSEKIADREAWRIVQDSFPRLRNFEGCE